MEFFQKKSNTIRSKPVQHQNNLIVPQPNYCKFGTKSPNSLGPKIWNYLSVNIKSAETFEVFKKTHQIRGRRNVSKSQMCTYKNL